MSKNLLTTLFDTLATHWMATRLPSIQCKPAEHICAQGLLRDLINSLPELVAYKNIQGVYLNCNQAFEELVGLSEAEIIGKTDRDLFPLEVQEALQNQDHQTLKSNETSYLETWLNYPNGQRVWFEIIKTPFHTSNGNLLGILSTSRDITLRKQSEEKLKQAAQVLENSSEAICITSAETEILAVNKAFTQITGFTKDEAVGNKVSRLLKSGKHGPSFYKSMWDGLNNVGHWQGEVWNKRKNGEIYPEWLNISVIRDDKTGVVTHYLAIFSDISAHKRNEQRLAYLAHYDDLTGLPNRTLFREKVERALLHARQYQTKLAVLFLDLDRFKYINDTWGHAIGDLLLRDVANRLVECVRKQDTIARLGGDEFTAVLENIEDTKEVAEIAQRILDAFRPQFFLHGHETFITTSIGISLYPNDGCDADTLLKNADAAMYRAKEGGKNDYQFFALEMNEHARQRLILETQLRHALGRGEFQLYYQPQMHLASGHITGAEVLLRWMHPEVGIVTPHTFIPLAEETGLVVEIGEWVLYKACLQHREWRESGKPILRLAVNLSSRQFKQDNLAQNIIRIIKDTDMDPTLLELELTESVLMQDADAAAEILRELKSIGIQLAIDDFGTGYSSLNYLRRFPLDKLKIDKSFIHDIPEKIEDMTIAKTIVSLARNLHLGVIAEGVENKSQLAFLKSLKCDEVQGYLIGHPVSSDEFIARFKS
jgi:diguanylate cyclase (GGDEF)-like protein/PAS domain S-box-containing protein